MYVCVYRLRVGQWAEPVVVLLSSCIPEAQVDWFAVHHDVCRVVVKSMGKQCIKSLDLIYCSILLSVSFLRQVNVHEWRTSCTYTVGMYSPGKALVV